MSTYDGGAPARPHGWSGPVVVLPLILGFIQLIGSTFASHEGVQPGRVPLDAFGYVLLVAGPAALVARRRYPVTVAAVVAAVTLLYLLLLYPYGPIMLSLAVGLFSAVAAGYRLAGWVIGAATLATHWGVAYLFGLGSSPGLAGMGAMIGVLVALLVSADMARVRRERDAEARRTREEEARRRAGDERMRIARELHDVLAHNISMINVQAGVALHLIEERPEQASTALTAIKQASKEALTEMRSVIDVLRQVDEAPPRAPARGLAQLPDLVEKASVGGLTVYMDVSGDQRSLPAGTDLAAFRIVQEALTNVTRHARASTATVTVTYGDRILTVRVDDDGRGGIASDDDQDAAPAEGNGISGMRERAAALGGDLAVGRNPNGGFRVHATLPLSETEPSDTEPSDTASPPNGATAGDTPFEEAQ